MRRFGQIIGINANRIDEYISLHTSIWPEITLALAAAEIHNYSIFHRGDLLFGYYEYRGPEDEYDERMAMVAASPKMAEWWAVVGDMQRPLPGRAPGAWWVDMDCAFHMD